MKHVSSMVDLGKKKDAQMVTMISKARSKVTEEQVLTYKIHILSIDLSHNGQSVFERAEMQISKSTSIFARLNVQTLNKSNDRKNRMIERQKILRTLRE